MMPPPTLNPTGMLIPFLRWQLAGSGSDGEEEQIGGCRRHLPKFLAFSLQLASKTSIVIVFPPRPVRNRTTFSHPHCVPYAPTPEGPPCAGPDPLATMVRVGLPPQSSAPSDGLGSVVSCRVLSGLGAPAQRVLLATLGISGVALKCRSTAPVHCACPCLYHCDFGTLDPCYPRWIKRGILLTKLSDGSVKESRDMSRVRNVVSCSSVGVPSAKFLLGVISNVSIASGLAEETTTSLHSNPPTPPKTTLCRQGDLDPGACSHTADRASFIRPGQDPAAGPEV